MKPGVMVPVGKAMGGTLYWGFLLWKDNCVFGCREQQRALKDAKGGVADYLCTDHSISLDLTGMQGIWSRFFPAMEALREALVKGTIGDLRVARAEFGMDLRSVPRATDWNQAGGGLLDLGIYCVQFLSMVFGAQKPEKISAVGRIHETGTL